MKGIKLNGGQMQLPNNYYKTAEDMLELWKRRRHNAVRLRAIKCEVPFTISIDDIPTPTTCVYLGIKLSYVGGGRLSAATVDRIIPALGYVPGNVQVISYLANTMKTDASIEQMLTFARNVITIHGK